jgi:tetratricopeptide (TPR) repeat protein
MKKARVQSNVKKTAAKAKATSRTAKKKSPSPSKATVAKVKLAPWQSRWPNSADLGSWFRCGIDKCYAIAKPEKGSEEAHLFIESLAELGHTAEALKHVEKFIKRLPKNDSFESARQALLGAKICLDVDDLVGMENYLTRVRATDERITRKCDIGFGTHCDKDFRVFNGLLNPADLDSSDEDYHHAAYNFAERAFKKARSENNISEAKKQLAAMAEAAKLDKSEWTRSMWNRRIIELASEVDDTDLIKTLIQRIPARERHEKIGYKVYSKIGMKTEALKAAERIVNEKIDELLSMEDPNIHFPIHSITEALTFLIAQNEKKLANKLFKKVAESAASWKCVIKGWTTTAVLTSFVPIVEQLEGVEAARELASLASEHAAGEGHKGFKRGAQSAAMAATAAVNPLDEAIAQARKLRSPSGKRMELGKLFAKAGRWKELKEVLSGVATPEEAAKIAWWIKFELPGGEVE